ncbi:MAG: phenylalanine--tRNA ligase subunit alpha [Clostridia bacterium]|nr:phenylalanine--tRNA ligase subunit alpha [Clostridia bacterium]
MIQTINTILNDGLQVIQSAKSQKELLDAKVAVLGKNGSLTSILRNLKSFSAEERPIAGKLVNEARGKLEQAFATKFEELKILELTARLEKEKIDITVPSQKRNMGRLHPMNVVKAKVLEYFVSMGFTVDESPEIETDRYNFDMLNTPVDHPARNLQDTLFVTDKILLRSQTSAGQIRKMEKTAPPIKMVSPGRVYRADEIDATHTPCFHQVEGLVVDKGITMCDLKGILSGFARYFFSADTKTRFRPSHFPFTEPSVEVDASCSACGGKGCRVCKGTGWIEILGAGMVNRNVLSGCGIDPDVYTGFAFGMGLDRITAILYGINDARVSFEGDIRFLKQFD